MDKKNVTREGGVLNTQLKKHEREKIRISLRDNIL